MVLFLEKLQNKTSNLYSRGGRQKQVGTQNSEEFNKSHWKVPALWLKSSAKSEKMKFWGIWFKKLNDDDSISKIDSFSGCPFNSELLKDPPPDASPIDWHDSKKVFPQKAKSALLE